MIEDEIQIAAATSEAAQVLVIAPPGCGKTELLAMRADALIPRLLPNQRILALTFSNRARDNLAERMRAHLGAYRYRRYVRVRNFHGHATEIITAHCRTIGLDPNLVPPTKQLLERALRAASNNEAEIAAAKDALSAAKRAPHTDDQVAALLAASGSSLAIAIEQARAHTAQLHYDDLLRHAQRLLLIAPVARLYQQHYGAVLVDEFQDLSPQQLDIALRSCAANRTFVGDPLQGIYGWAGAEPVAVHAQLTTLCGDPYRLTKSYRSSPAVLTVLNSIGVRLGAAALESGLPGAWPNGGASTAAGFATGAEEADWIAARCADIHANHPDATIGVIARSGYRRKPVNAAFAARPDLPCRHWDLAVDNQDTIDRLERAANALPRSASFADLRDKALVDLDSNDVDARSDIEEAVTEIELTRQGADTVRSAVRRHLRFGTDQNVSPGVHLLNAHTGKGQQFDWVFVLGLEEGHVPDFRCTTAEELLEEQRVLLVMLSRAKTGVAVTKASELISKRGSPYSRDASRWWDALVAAATMTPDQFEGRTGTSLQ
jgi:DNA helicase-2/ATP-dependent DNA helicase PcrA